jgi:hypothetical protein
MPMMTPTSNPYLGLGQMTLKSPSGYEVSLTEAEERAVTHEALLDRARMTINRGERRRDVVTNATISAAGNAVGFAVGGIILGLVLNRWGKR